MPEFNITRIALMYSSVPVAMMFAVAGLALLVLKKLNSR